MRLSRSFWGKALVTVMAAAWFVWLYEVTIPDSKFSLLPLSFERLLDPSAPPAPGARAAFSSTAYCKGLVTSSGVAAQKGVMAADPGLLPVGSVVDFAVNDVKYDGIYTILDTGPEIKGREVDIYMWSCYEALKFGRKAAHLTVLRLGWNPRATTPTLIDRIFRRPEPKAPLPSRPLPIEPGAGQE
jgi:3D (Asp-Asp-Asp) domain-containing protein